MKMVMKIARLWCVLFGCGYDDYGNCPRCGEHIYEGFRYVEHGRLDWLVRLYWRLKWQVFTRWFRRCDVCKRYMHPWGKYANHYCCSKRCEDQWVPF